MWIDELIRLLPRDLAVPRPLARRATLYDREAR